MSMHSRERIFRFLLLALAFAPARVLAHCDTLDGPVVADARAALEKGEPTPALKWVRPADEPEIRETFRKTMAVRAKGEDARELADRFFFETLVRLHRAGEGAPFTGLKPAGTEVEPAIAAADKALVEGSPDRLVDLVVKDVAKGIRDRYEKARAARQRKEESITNGREFVEAYVVFVHYVEAVHALASGAAAHGEKAPAAAGHEGHASPEHK